MLSPDSFYDLEPTPGLLSIGARFGDRGTHTSRTMMSVELQEALYALPADAKRTDYAEAIVEENILAKATYATRKLTNQRLAELYGLSPRIPIFAVLRHLWDLDREGRPLLTLLVALARDPLLRASAPTILELPPGNELSRSRLVNNMRVAVGSRLNDSILDKVARNLGSSWTQSGHLLGRVRKVRQRIEPTPASVAFALWIGEAQGYHGSSALNTIWTAVLDAEGHDLIDLVLAAKRRGLIGAQIGGGLTEIDTSPLNPVSMN